MKKSSWILSALAAFGLANGAAQAQQPQPMPAPPAPVVINEVPTVLGNSCCGSCTTGCCDSGCERHGGPIFDIGFMILTPHWADNPAGYLDGGLATSPHLQQDFNFSSQFVPRASLGYVADGGLGVRVGWWGIVAKRTEQISDPTLFAFPTSPLNVVMAAGIFDSALNLSGPLTAEAQLHMDVWDLEVVDEIRTEKCSLLLSGGIRYAHVSQRYDAVVIDGDDFAAAILSGHSFTGAGPTVAIDARRHIGNTGLYLFASSRGSLLLGHSHQDAFAGSGTGGTPAEAVANVVFTAEAHTNSRETVLPVGEIEVGGGYETIGRRVTAFVQAGFVGQVWFNAGNSSRSNYDVNLNANNGTFADGTPTNDNLLLMGFSMKAGLRW